MRYLYTIESLFDNSFYILYQIDDTRFVRVGLTIKKRFVRVGLTIKKMFKKVYTTILVTKKANKKKRSILVSKKIFVYNNY